MGAPALDPAAGCPPAADLPWLSVCGSLLSSPCSRCPLLPSGGTVSQTRTCPSAAISLPPRTGCPSPLRGAALQGSARLRGCVPLRRRRLRRLSGGWLFLRDCQDLRWRRRYFLHRQRPLATSTVVHGTTVLVRPSPGFSTRFVDKLPIPPIGGFLPPRGFRRVEAVTVRGSNSSLRKNPFPAVSSHASFLPLISGSSPAVDALPVWG